MEEIDTDNIVGRRTREKKIDFVSANEAAGDLDESDEDDEDFEGDDDDAMQE